MAGVPRCGRPRGLGGPARRCSGGVRRRLARRRRRARRGGCAGPGVGGLRGAADGRRRSADGATDPGSDEVGDHAHRAGSTHLGGGRSSTARSPIEAPCRRSSSRSRRSLDEIDVGFWRAVLGYDPLAPDNGVDPLGHGSTFWVQDLDPEKPLRHAMHVDVSVAREHAEAACRCCPGGRRPGRRRFRRPRGLDPRRPRRQPGLRRSLARRGAALAGVTPQRARPRVDDGGR